MPDICMCTSECCYRSPECKRHPDSGTKPSDRQAWGDFDEIRYWDPDNCSGFWPLFGSMPHEKGAHR